jgi:hypothetical protein
MKPLPGVRDMPLIEGLNTPRQFYVVLTEPALLAGMYRPDAHTPWRRLYDAGFSDIVCLASETLGYDPSPLRQFTADMEDLHHGNEPGDPVNEERLVREMAALVLEMLSSKEGVIVHCYGGNGRTGTVIGCVLKALGYSSDEIVPYYDGLAKLRGRPGWPESPWQERMIRRF